MQVQYSIKGADLFVAQKYANKQQGVRGKYSPFVYIVCLFGLLFLFPLLWPANTVAKGSPLSLVRSLTQLLAPFLFLFIFFRVMRRQKSAEWETTGKLSRPRRIELLADYVYNEDEDSKSVTSWRGIYNVVEGKEHIFLFTGTKDGFVIPKRCFASPQEAQHFFQTALSYWEQARIMENKPPLPHPNSK